MTESKFSAWVKAHAADFNNFMLFMVSNFNHEHEDMISEGDKTVAQP